MASDKKRKQKAKIYSAEWTYSCLFGGILIAALGLAAILIYLGIFPFRSVKSFLQGLGGSLTLPMAAMVVWGGAELGIASNRKPHARIFGQAVLLLLLAMAALTLTVNTGSGLYMDYRLAQNMNANYVTAADFGTYMNNAYRQGMQYGTTGGALGMLLAWPMWRPFTNSIPAIVICVLLILVDVFFMVPSGVRKKLLNRDPEQHQKREMENADYRRQVILQQQAQQSRQDGRRQGGYDPYAQPRQEYGAGQHGGRPSPWQTGPQQPSRTPVSSRNGGYGFAPAGHERYQQSVAQPYDEKVHTTRPTGRSSIYDKPVQTAPQNVRQAAAQMSQSSRHKPQTAPQMKQPVRPAAPGAEEMPRQGTGSMETAMQNGYAAMPGKETRPAEKAPRYGMPPLKRPAPAAAEETADTGMGFDQYGGQIAETPVRPETVRPAPSAAPVYEEQPAPVQQPRPAQIPAEQPVWPHEAAPVPQPAVKEATEPVWEPEKEIPPEPVWDEPAPVQPVRTENIPAESSPAPRPAAAAARGTANYGFSPRPAGVSVSLPPWEREPEPEEEDEEPFVPQPYKPDLKLPPSVREPVEEEEQPFCEIPYVFPDKSLLRNPEPPSQGGDEEDAMLSQRLEETLQSFKVPAKVRHVTHGPAISRFELEIAPGIRVNKITELDRNIAMNMEVKSVRIEAPIPGKSLVGVEVPNRKVTPVTLKEVLETDAMRQMNSTLGVALGKDIAGVPIVCDLARMPHLLIAGATGSGKSVCINTIINSLLYRTSPKDVKLILVDPKVVELQPYNDLPHLLLPVVTDPHKAAGALQWAVAEMMERYHRFTEQSVRDIKGYNAKVGSGELYMPRIVIIIDELADLMMTCKKDVEESICRIAQLARAAGIHLIVATQRPSVDVITGLIKANIPSRIAFKVSSFVDSRTIIDRPGADKLLGYGDMLYLPNGAFTPVRVQGCYLSDDEINETADYIRLHNTCHYDTNMIEQLDNIGVEEETVKAPDDVAPTGSNDGDLLLQALEMTVQDGQTSTSMLQRRLRIGFARAGRLVDEMEKRGFVSQKDGAKPRMCLITREQLEELKASGALSED